MAEARWECTEEAIASAAGALRFAAALCGILQCHASLVASLIGVAEVEARPSVTEGDAFDRCCRKSRKSKDTENLAKVVFSTLLLPQGTLEPIRGPVVVFV